MGLTPSITFWETNFPSLYDLRLRNLCLIHHILKLRLRLMLFTIILLKFLCSKKTVNSLIYIYIPRWSIFRFLPFERYWSINGLSASGSRRFKKDLVLLFSLGTYHLIVLKYSQRVAKPGAVIKNTRKEELSSLLLARRGLIRSETTPQKSRTRPPFCNSRHRALPICSGYCSLFPPKSTEQKTTKSQSSDFWRLATNCFSHNRSIPFPISIHHPLTAFSISLAPSFSSFFRI